MLLGNPWRALTVAALQPGLGTRAPTPTSHPAVNDHGAGRQGKALWLLTTITSRPLIPVAVPEAASQGCNFQVGPGPRATPLLNQSLSRSYLISWLSGWEALPPGSGAWEPGFGLAHLGMAGFLLASSLSLSGSLQLSWGGTPGLPLLTPHPSPLTPSLPHQLQTFLTPPFWLNHAFLLPKGPQLGFLPDNLKIRADKCRGLSHKKWENGPEIKELASLLHPPPSLSILQNA